jgi:hypothetical protein
MSTTNTRTVILDQLWYGWSQSTLAGRRGYGVIAASEGWDPLLRAGEDALGPAVTFPEGLTGPDVPPSGGFVVLDGVPVAFRRVPVRADGLDRPGSYAVRLVSSRHDPLDALDAVRLLDQDVLAGEPPDAGVTLLDPLTWSADASPDSVDAAEGSVALLAAGVLQCRLEDRPVVALVRDEPAGRALLGAVLGCLPTRVRRGLSFSTLETRVSGVPFDVVFRVAQWGGTDPGSNRSAILLNLLDLDDNAGLSPDARRWGRQLAAMDSPPWNAAREPADVTQLGRVLDVVATSQSSPDHLSATDLLTLADTRVAAAWAQRPGARSSAERALRDATAQERTGLLHLSMREPAVAEVMTDAAWQCLSGGLDAGAATDNAEALLLGLGVPQDEIDLVAVRRLPIRQGPYTPAESTRILRTLTTGRTELTPTDWAQLARLDWSPELRHQYRAVWLEAVMRAPGYRGARLDNGEAAQVSDQALRLALTRATAAGVTPEDAGRRIMGILPARAGDRAHLLTRLSRTPTSGVDAVFLGALTCPAATDRDRSAVLGSSWPYLVTVMDLPDYFGRLMVARSTPAHPRLSQRGRLIGAAALVVVLIAVVAAVVLL